MYKRFEYLVLSALIILLGHVVGVDYKVEIAWRKANNLIDEIRKELE